MFDPSKLNLDIDENENKAPTSKEDIKNALESVEKNSIKKNVEENKSEFFKESSLKNDDILKDSVKLKEVLDPLDNPLDWEKELVIENTSKENIIENTSKPIEAINKSFIESDEKKDIIKEIEKKEEEKEEQEKSENIVWDISWIVDINKKMAEKEKNISKRLWEDDLIDINIKSLDDLLNILIKEDFDIFIMEPRENDVKISFRKEKVEKDVKYIKFPVYTQILLKAKALSKLKVEETKINQEWKSSIQIKDKSYSTIAKTVPSSFWEKILFKIALKNKKVTKKVKSETSLSKLFWFLWVIAIIALIIWGGFIGFIVMNAKNIEDVKFFSSLWISLNDINIFISKAINIIFSILIFIETVFLAIYLFKALLTKKIYKRKKVLYTILSIFIFIITFSTWLAWMTINEKINKLPNWQEMAYWDVQIFDNSKLNNERFWKKQALVQDTSNMIWPVTLKYDLTFWAKKEEWKWLIIKRYKWNFWEKTKESLTPNIINKFEEAWTTDISVEIIWVDARWEEVNKVIENIPSVSISNIVKIEEEMLEEWGKTVIFDATDLKDLWKIEWYILEEDPKEKLTPIDETYIYNHDSLIFEDTVFGMAIRRDWNDPELLDKIFIIEKQEKNTIEWKIEYTQDLVNERKYTIKVSNPKTKAWNGFIEEFNWNIEDEIINKISDKRDIEKSSTITHIFKKYGEQKISVKLTDTSWKTRTINTVIKIPKKLQLRSSIKVLNDWKKVEWMTYDNKLNEYLIEGLPAPTKLLFDARRIRANNILYWLRSVWWDTNDDWTIDKTWKMLDFPINVEWNFTVVAHYKFSHRKIKGDDINIKERIYIESNKKEAIINLKVDAKSEYVPTNVSFDASASQIKWKNIQKFIYDYGDWIIEERDAINPSHRYTAAWEYEIKLTIVTTDGSKYHTTRKLILKPQPQKAKIVSSLKKAPIYQWIDFSSDESQWQVVTYYWDFWDWEVSTDANPTHEYEVAWTYTVLLKTTFANNNILTDEIDITITE